MPSKTRKKVVKLLLSSLLFVTVTLVYACQSNNTHKSKKGSPNLSDEASLINSGISSADEVNVIKKWDLPNELREISGLSYLDAERLVCVQDEAGKVYIYNISSEKIEREISFAGAGDYEGLAVVGSDIWVLRADGALFELKNIEASKPQVKEYGTLLTIAQDCEGLCYDSSANRLLITVKGKDPNSTDYKGIYAFDLATRSMAKEPAYKIDLSHEVFASSQSGKKKKKKAGTMMPSGIAVHPISRELYITDGGKSQLLVTAPNGEIKKLVQLDQKVFAQPEGIIFNTKGDLFISNEGPKGPGNILQVELKEIR